MILAGLPTRGTDTHGSGKWMAPRGSRKHKGVDFACYPDTEIYSGSAGQVTKLGYPYADKLQYRYVEVTTPQGIKYRYFYVKPSVEVGNKVDKGTLLGLAQDLTDTYPGITNHVHFEVMDLEGKKVNPWAYLEKMSYAT